MLRGVAGAYVTFLTNTPALVQVYFIYFALPSIGILLDSFDAVLLGLTLNAGAYLTEIQRTGFASVHQSEVEAAETLGMGRWQTVRYVILPHVIRTLYPPLTGAVHPDHPRHVDGRRVRRRGTDRPRLQRECGDVPAPSRSSPSSPCSMR